ncbi:hypothetical protein QUR06_000246 [Escherichia coli]|nr:hypothetical protein [Escherichia coli]
MSMTAIKLAFVKATRPELEGIELEAAVAAVDVTSSEYEQFERAVAEKLVALVQGE